MYRQAHWIIVLCMLLGVITAQAQESATTPLFTPWSGAFQVKESVPFVWLRLEPNGSQMMATIPSGGVVRAFPSNLAPDAHVFWDSVHQQWWGLAYINSTSGWVEMRSLIQLSPGDPYPSATPQAVGLVPPDEWQAGMKLRVKTSVPFVWIRMGCDSNAEVLHTLVRGQTVWMPAGHRYYDGVQYWRTISLLGRYGLSGCVEKKFV